MPPRLRENSILRIVWILTLVLLEMQGKRTSGQTTFLPASCRNRHGARRALLRSRGGRRGGNVARRGRGIGIEADGCLGVTEFRHTRERGRQPPRASSPQDPRPERQQERNARRRGPHGRRGGRSRLGSGGRFATRPPAAKQREDIRPRRLVPFLRGHLPRGESPHQPGQQRRGPLRRWLGIHGHTRDDGWCGRRRRFAGARRLRRFGAQGDLQDAENAVVVGRITDREGGFIRCSRRTQSMRSSLEKNTSGSGTNRSPPPESVVVAGFARELCLSDSGWLAALAGRSRRLAFQHLLHPGRILRR